MVLLILKYKKIIIKNILSSFKRIMDFGHDNVKRRYFKWNKRIITKKRRIFIEQIKTVDKGLGTSYGSNATIRVPTKSFQSNKLSQWILHFIFIVKINQYNH